MEISIETLKQLLSKAFDLGYTNCEEFKTELVEELLNEAKTVVVNKSDEAYRIWKAAELRNMPEGTLFHHSVRGRCWVVIRPNGGKAIQFQKGNPVGLISDNEPWDSPMKLIHSEK